jgi:hypothetical protein
MNGTAVPYHNKIKRTRSKRLENTPKKCLKSVFGFCRSGLVCLSVDCQNMSAFLSSIKTEHILLIHRPPQERQHNVLVVQIFFPSPSSIGLPQKKLLSQSVHASLKPSRRRRQRMTSTTTQIPQGNPKPCHCKKLLLSMRAIRKAHN